MAKKTFVIGTRGSNLALWQANHIKDLLQQSDPSLTVEVQIVKTKGDKILDVALSKIGDKGLFTKELERALLDGDVDMCVHSMKDMPTALPEGLTIACMPTRADVRDALIGFDTIPFMELPAGARVATGSLRRNAQLAAVRPDIELCEIRGNVETRINKVKTEGFSATLLAVSGVERLGLEEVIIERFDPSFMIPAVGQGAIGVEIRENDEETRSALAPLCDADTMAAVEAERHIMRVLEGGCHVPLGAYARKESADCMVIDAFVSHLDGSSLIRVREEGHPNDSLAIAQTVTEKLLAQGAREVLKGL